MHHWHSSYCWDLLEAKIQIHERLISSSNFILVEVTYSLKITSLCFGVTCQLTFWLHHTSQHLSGLQASSKICLQRKNRKALSCSCRLKCDCQRSMSLIEIYFVQMEALCSRGSAALTWEICSTQLRVCLFNDNRSKSESFSKHTSAKTAHVSQSQKFLFDDNTHCK